MGKASLGMAFERMAGGQGDLVVARNRAGLTTRAKPKYRYPKIPAVLEGNARLRAANLAWNEMTIAQAEAWNRYAEGLPPKTGFDGGRYATTGKNVLVAYVSKILQVDPRASIPFDPPRAPYTPPYVEVAVSAGEGSLVFSSTAATPPGTVVELMVQPLINGKRKPAAFFKHAAFATFAEAGSTVAIPVAAGWYAGAYQCVEPSTGRVAGWMPLGKIEVESS